MIPYGKQTIDEQDIEAVVEVLRSDWITTGPAVDAFEHAVASFTGADHAVAVSSGTAALHAAMYAIGIGPEDEVIVPAITFAATANAVVFQKGRPVFADVAPETLLIDPASVEKLITPQTRAIVCVDFAGHPCDYDALSKISDSHGIPLVADACHALGASYKGRKAGTLADLSVFSFHPVKHITTGEGGMITVRDQALAARMRMFRNHCLDSDHRQRSEKGSWFYQMVDLGYNYRITDFQCALGLSQLTKLAGWLERRRAIAHRYISAFSAQNGADPLGVSPDVGHAYHLFVVRVPNRDSVFEYLRKEGIGVNVHYMPVYLHPYYQTHFNTRPGLCPVAEEAYRRILSLPMYASLNDDDVCRVIEAVKDCAG